ncbi:hypothetical protein QYE76_048821 [Lolium multiflorum]|uniref:Wall-associated receptor kinase galacturonan-binding domain-containing protein n=1 Tax=Lolium multiflorum TaxID=4521 RepID=A0AAD8SNE0_LOLMU|nr:hypothetical protein QYE76_048821 [Lolium multiflorum]
MLWLLLLPLASVLRSASGGGNTSCTEESCGDLTIRFPFSLAGVQPLYCGYPPFDLTCDAGLGRAQAYLSNTFRERLFRVANISYTNNSMVAAFAGNGGCPVPDFNVSGSLTFLPFTISGTNKKLVFFYDCHVPPQLRLSLPQLCGNRTVGAYISGLWDGSEGDTLPRGVPANCSSVSVPVRDGGMETASLLYYELLMAGGFLLDLPPPLGDCYGCRRVGGECRSDRLLSFMCVCPDGKLCPSFAQSNSTTRPGITRSVFSLTLHRLF